MADVTREALPTRRSLRQPATPPQGRWWIEGLDGWRALAIIAVLIFHLRPGTLPGGFLGVDVFFVISGFLITTLLIRELAKNGRINLPQFWVRRARRLLPALVTVVITATVLAFFAGGDLLVGIVRHIVGALTFSNNWVEIAAGSDYFAASTPNLFMNFWSLAVEEQFYLTWPILAILVMATLPTGKARVILLGGAALVSAIAMAVLYDPDAITRVYYGTDTHAFGLLLGAALAFAMAAPDIAVFDHPRWQRLRVPVALAGFALVLTLMFTLDGEGAFAYRGGLVLASVGTAAMVAALPGPATALTRVLKARPIEWVGVRSYGIYMWHWPAILIVDAAWPPATPDSASWWVSRGVALGATLALAAASFTYIENPIRKDGFKGSAAKIRAWLGRIPVRGRTFVGVLAGATAALFAIALLSAPSQSTLERSMRQAEEYISAETPGAAGELTAATKPAPTPQQSELSPPPDEAEEPAPEVADAWDADISAELVIPPSEIYGVGDSMLYVAAPAMNQAFPGMVINAKSNRQWPHVLEEVTAAVAAEEVPAVVVIGAGTNAGAREVDLVEETIQVLGPQRRIVLVNIYSGSSFVAETNENYAAMAEKYANVEVADWYTAARENPGDLQPDKIHPNMTGMGLWAGTVAEAFAELNITVEPPAAD